jgi:hypothetical protein
MTDTARIYAFADLAAVTASRGAITRAILQTLSVTGDRHRVTVADGSGWIDAVALDDLWARPTPAALLTPDAAQAKAEGFLTALDKAMSPASQGWPASLRGVAVLPPAALLTRAELIAVPMRDGSGWNHWLYRAQPTLLLGDAGNTRAPVYGTCVDVRVGHRGQIVGFTSSWRPTGVDRKTVPLSDYAAPAELDADAVGNNDPPPMVYLLHGAAMPQLYLAPYYLAGAGHDLIAVSASPYSLTLDVGRTAQGAETMTLMTLARGGSGRYAYRWATMALDDPETGLTDRGSGTTATIDAIEGRATASSIAIENGTFIVMVNVRDEATGAFAHFQQQVFASPLVADDAGASLVS